MRADRMIAALVASLVILGACTMATSPPGDAARIDPGLVAVLEVDDATAVGDAVNAFGFDLLHEVAEEGENAITSPLSVAVLLAMVLAGADGETAEAMAEVLRLEDARDVRVGALLRDLANTDDVTLSVANALWADTGIPFEAAYLDFVHATFGATVDEADLGEQETADAIDVWVDERTEGLIDAIAEDLGLPNPAAVLVLLNAVYFLGEWTTPFDTDHTRDEPFTLGSGEDVAVPLMHLRGETFEYAVRDGYRMLRLPYGDEERYGMEVLLPDDGVGVTTLLSALDAEEWQSATEALAEQPVDELALPRFELAWEAELNEPLEALGMGVAFSSAADFRPMSPANPWLDIVAHKTYIRVDEEGTEAAAVTGGVMVTSAPADPVVFRVDRPFAFTISDVETGTILFLGAVADPR